MKPSKNDAKITKKCYQARTPEKTPEIVWHQLNYAKLVLLDF